MSWQASYLSSVAIIWASIGIYQFTHYYKGFLSYQTQDLLLALALAYTILAPFYYLLAPGRFGVKPSKAFIALCAIRRSIPELTKYLKTFPYKNKTPLPKITEKERVAILFLVVKFFFLPLMINFLFTNLNSVRNTWPDIMASDNIFSIQYFNQVLFMFVFTVLILIDVAVFTFGYLTESRFLRNEVRSVEPTFFGWFVTLICYPPFNSLIGIYVVWYANEHTFYWNDKTSFIMRIIALALMFVYTFASVALGPKASNLTNRGIVGWGPYALVRHPAYITKNLAWWLTILPVISVAAVLSMAFVSLIYYFRAITEERHLIRDPDYRAYCKKVRYRFIPKLI